MQSAERKSALLGVSDSTSYRTGTPGQRQVPFPSRGVRAVGGQVVCRRSASRWAWKGGADRSTTTVLVCVSFRPREPRLACSTSVSERAVCSDAGIFSVPRSLRSSDLPRVPGSRGRAGPWSSTIREDGNTQCCSPAERRGEEKAMARDGSGGRKNGWSPGEERGRSTNDSCY
jgi:hypothetical protein